VTNFAGTLNVLENSFQKIISNHMLC